MPEGVCLIEARIRYVSVSFSFLCASSLFSVQRLSGAGKQQMLEPRTLRPFPPPGVVSVIPALQHPGVGVVVEQQCADFARAEIPVVAREGRAPPGAGEPFGTDGFVHGEGV